MSTRYLKGSTNLKDMQTKKQLHVLPIKLAKMIKIHKYPPPVRVTEAGMLTHCLQVVINTILLENNLARGTKLLKSSFHP